MAEYHSRVYTMRAYEQKYDKAFLMPEMCKITDLVESHQVVLNTPGGNAAPTDPHYYFLGGEYVYRPDGQQCWATVWANLGRIHAGVLRPYMRGGDIGRIQVFKRGWPDNLALMLATDRMMISSRWLSLIDHDHYKSWLSETIETALEYEDGT
jgi:hypothetical protein